MGWWRKLIGSGGPPVPERLPVLATVTLPPAPPVKLRGDQVLRKQFTIDILQQHGIPTIAHLPAVESEAEVELPGADQVAQRLAALTIVAVKGEGLDAESVDAIVDERGMHGWFSPKEAAFVADRAPSERDRIRFSWNYEAAWTLYWALNFLEGQLGMPRAVCDVPLLVRTVRDTPDLAINGLRRVGHVLTEADLAYRCHWAVRDAMINGKPIPGGLNPGVVAERHRTLNWLIRHREEAWDDVDTPT